MNSELGIEEYNKRNFAPTLNNECYDWVVEDTDADADADTDAETFAHLFVPLSDDSGPNPSFQTVLILLQIPLYRSLLCGRTIIYIFSPVAYLSSLMTLPCLIMFYLFHVSVDRIVFCCYR